MGYTAAPSIHTSIWQLSVCRLYRQSSTGIDLEAERGRPYRLCHHCFVAVEAEPQEGGGLARAWTTCGPKVLGTNAPMKRRMAQRGQWPRGSDFVSFCSLLLTCHSCQISTIVHSVVLPTIFDKYTHTKIEENLLKSVAYIMPDIHVPLFNPYMPELLYCKVSN